MRLKVLALTALIVCIFATVPAFALEAGFVYAPESLSPGKAERICISVDTDCAITLELLDSQGNIAHTLRSNLQIGTGMLNLTYNGLNAQGEALPAGEYTLRLQAGDQTVLRTLTIGEVAPQIRYIAVQNDALYIDEPLPLSIIVTADGTLSLTLTGIDNNGLYPLEDTQIQAGSSALNISLPGNLPAGEYTLNAVLASHAGLSSSASTVTLRFSAPATPTPQPTATPAPVYRASKSTTETILGDFWSMEIGNYDWAAIWDVMISPMTVISGTGKEAEKQVYRLRATPDKSTARSNIVGEITCETQGVHVLETRDDGWTLVEAYNSSYGPNNSNRRGYGTTDELIQGYVETKKLKTFTPKTEYGLLIDKMTQRLYILTKGGLFTTLLISTGYPTSDKPWNETPAGEFYLSSKVGDFPSGNMTCGYGMRFNCGDILHETPYILNEKYNIKDYSYTEKYLGEKASHGCVRVQRKQNEDGINMKWIWDNVPLGTKLLIWDEDLRPIPYPVEDDTIFYYNPTGGKNYHADQNCSYIRDKYLPLQGQCTYADLDSEAYSYLTPCKHCDPPVKKSTIDAQNAEKLQ